MRKLIIAVILVALFAFFFLGPRTSTSVYEEIQLPESQAFELNSDVGKEIVLSLIHTGFEIELQSRYPELKEEDYGFHLSWGRRSGIFDGGKEIYFINVRISSPIDAPPDHDPNQIVQYSRESIEKAVQSFYHKHQHNKSSYSTPGSEASLRE